MILINIFLELLFRKYNSEKNPLESSNEINKSNIMMCVGSVIKIDEN